MGMASLHGGGGGYGMQSGRNGGLSEVRARIAKPRENARSRLLWNHLVRAYYGWGRWGGCLWGRSINVPKKRCIEKCNTVSLIIISI